MRRPDIDQIAVERACEGDRTVSLNRDEALLAFRRLERRGLSASAIAIVLGVTERTVHRWRNGLSEPVTRPGVGAKAPTPPAPTPPAPTPPPTPAPPPKKQPPAVRFYTVDEVALEMRVSRMTIYRLVQRGELGAVRVGRRSFRIPTGALERYLRQQEMPGEMGREA